MIPRRKAWARGTQVHEKRTHRAIKHRKRWLYESREEGLDWTREGPQEGRIEEEAASPQDQDEEGMMDGLGCGWPGANRLMACRCEGSDRVPVPPARREPLVPPCNCQRPDLWLDCSRCAVCSDQCPKLQKVGV